jgi:hypothetical protein
MLAVDVVGRAIAFSDQAIVSQPFRRGGRDGLSKGATFLSTFCRTCYVSPSLPGYLQIAKFFLGLRDLTVENHGPFDAHSNIFETANGHARFVGNTHRLNLHGQRVVAVGSRFGLVDPRYICQVVVDWTPGSRDTPKTLKAAATQDECTNLKDRTAPNYQGTSKEKRLVDRNNYFFSVRT